jgi:hypothetical protein
VEPPLTEKGIFISYVHEDHDVATAIGKFLKDQGQQNVFFTGNDWLLYAGEVWLERIREELTSARLVLCVFSPISIGRAWVHFEAGAAWFANKVVIPVCIRGLTVDQLKIPYAGMQAVTLTDETSGYYLVRSVCKHLPLEKGFPTPPPFRHDNPAWVALKATLSEAV